MPLNTLTFTSILSALPETKIFANYVRFESISLNSLFFRGFDAILIVSSLRTAKTAVHFLGIEFI